MRKKWGGGGGGGGGSWDPVIDIPRLSFIYFFRLKHVFFVYFLSVSLGEEAGAGGWQCVGTVGSPS